MNRNGLLLSCAALVVLTGCLGGLSPTQRLQEAAYDLNTASRFGRNDVALEHISKKGRDQFMQHHVAWSSSIRIVDCEVQGMALRDKENAEVYIAVAWQRPDESQVRGTSVTQRWKDHRGTWLLESEERVAGDYGVFGESTVVVRPPARGDVQFQTITIH